MQTGGHVLVNQLGRLGCDGVSIVPGVDLLAIMDGLYDARNVVTTVCRDAMGAAIMAEAAAKLTGRPGVCMVSGRDGLAAAIGGLNMAACHGTALLVIAALPPDASVAGPWPGAAGLSNLAPGICKHVAMIRDGGGIAQSLAYGYHVCRSGRAGPVLLLIAQDVIAARVNIDTVAGLGPVEAAPDPQDMAILSATLATASRPLLLLGGGQWDGETKNHIEAFATRFDLPVMCDWHCQNYFDNGHPCYSGHIHPEMSDAAKKHILESDVLIAVGCELGNELVPGAGTFLVHVLGEAGGLGIASRPDLAIGVPARPFARALGDLNPPQKSAWQDWRAKLCVGENTDVASSQLPVAVNMAQVIAVMQQVLPADAIVAHGTGRYVRWLDNGLRFDTLGGLLAPRSNIAGYGLAAAIAAKRQFPERVVIAICGDGEFVTAVQNLATAQQYGLALVVIVINNGVLGALRAKQSEDMPGRAFGTSLTNPDFVTLAGSFGGRGERVSRTVDFLPAFKRALFSNTVSLIDLKLDETFDHDQ